MNIGERIRQLRDAKHMTQQQLGERVGRSQQEIYRWEKGLLRVHADDLGLLAGALGVDVKAFYDETACTGEPIDWELQAATSHMTAKQRQKLIEYLNTVNPPTPL